MESEQPNARVAIQLLKISRRHDGRRDAIRNSVEVIQRGRKQARLLLYTQTVIFRNVHASRCGGGRRTAAWRSAGRSRHVVFINGVDTPKRKVERAERFKRLAAARAYVHIVATRNSCCKRAGEGSFSKQSPDIGDPSRRRPNLTARGHANPRGGWGHKIRSGNENGSARLEARSEGVTVLKTVADEMVAAVFYQVAPNCYSRRRRRGANRCGILVTYRPKRPLTVPGRVNTANRSRPRRVGLSLALDGIRGPDEMIEISDYVRQLRGESRISTIRASRIRLA